VKDAEVVIAGGGPAGLATALFLAHADPARGERIVVLEKARYPREKFCAGGLAARADALLETIGARVDVPSVPIAGASLALAAGETVQRVGAMARVVRRLEFDEALARIARARGVRVVEGARVEGVAVGPAGVAVESSAGAFRARVLVGADGVGSVVRRALGLPAGRLRAQVLELDTEPVAGDRARDLVHFDLADPGFTGYAWDFPTVVDGRALVCRGVYHLRLDDREVDLHAMLAARLSRLGLDIARYRLKRFAERGFELHRPCAAPRVLLVGEAAGIDALTGEGIAQAIEYGALAGPYLAEKLAGDDLRFDDWRARVLAARLGRDLRARAHFLPLLAAPALRPLLDRVLLDCPALVRAALEHFAGARVPRGPLARAVAGALPGAVAGWMAGVRAGELRAAARQVREARARARG
jgi:flavin-dependent dehydrogenase